MIFSIVENDAGTTLRWKDGGHRGISREDGLSDESHDAFYGLRDFEGMIGRDSETGLADLKKILEAEKTGP